MFLPPDASEADGLDYIFIFIGMFEESLALVPVSAPVLPPSGGNG